ncbi:ATP-binding protein [Adlercreutzia aquisgranensis]|uniref:ATP-binding protein n=1 Tax=Adlercreutzia aquisgranensis TaxID=2941323 RepID=UPI00203A5CD8|nr:ATP-binding protein [Adlercreutzia aquisgranensis]
MTRSRINSTLTAAVAALVIVASLAAVLYMTSLVNGRLSNNAERQVVLFTEQVAETVRTRMYAIQDALGAFTVQSGDPRTVLPALEALKDRMGFSFVAFAAMDGRGIRAAGEPFSTESLPVEETALSRGEESYSPTYESSRGEYARMAQKPLYIDGEQVGALYVEIPFGLFDISSMRKSYADPGTMVLVDAGSGEVLSYGGDGFGGILRTGDSLFQFLRDNSAPIREALDDTTTASTLNITRVGDSVQALEEGIARRQTCFFAAEIAGEPTYACLVPAGTGRWYVGTMVAETEVRSEESLVNGTLFAGAVVVLICLAIVTALGLSAYRRHIDSRNLEATAQLYQALSNSVNMAVNLYCPSDGETTPIVAKAKGIIGYAFAELVAPKGTLAGVQLSEEGRDLFDRLRRDLIKGDERGEFSLFSVADSSRRWVSYSVSPLRFKGKQQLLVVLRDATAEKSTQQSMREAMLAAEAANSAKSVFLSRMSHEIRTPMNGILGMLQVMRGCVNDPAAIEHGLDQMDAASNHLLGIINDVLDISKIESGSMTLVSEPFKLSRLLDGVCSIIKGQCDRRNQLFRDRRLFDEALGDASYLGDEARIRQLLLNLLSNSSKYTHPAGIVTLETRIELSSTRGYHDVTFIISDNGIGMEPEFLDRVFEPFAMEGRSHEQGTGLGMPIVRNIASMMGGSVEVRSQVDAGTVFTVKLPLKDAPRRCRADEDRKAPSFEVTAQPLEGKRVLVVEDNDLNAEIASTLLGQAGLAVELAGDGQQAVDLFREKPAGTYDAILMDIQMPVMGGYEATRQIRRSGKDDAESVPIIAMSANAFSEDVAKSMDAGMDMHLSKPIDMKKVLSALTELMG